MTSRQLDEERIFHVARELSSFAVREEYLNQICAGDQALRERVEALLDVHEQEQDFLKSSPEPAVTVDQPPISEGPGHQIGRYKLLQQIGEGGFGVVYMAEQERPVRRKVALKIIKPGMDTQAVVARFEAERQALALMDHSNISKVLDGGATDSGRPYFVMELVRGVPITEYCDKNMLSTQDRLGLFNAVCQAVQHAHQKGIIHRDLKPSNILITLHDGQPVVKVIDFGVAKAINQRLTEKTLFTAYGQMVGTPQYMSPEQAEMSGLDVDTRSDIYSLGVLLYELLTGTTPLESERLRTAGYAEMQRIIREEEAPKPSTRLSGSGERLTIIAQHRSATPERLHKLIRGDLDWIVMKAIEKDRNRRYESPSSLAHDVSNYLTNELVEARPPTFRYRSAKYLKRNRAALAVFGLLFTSLSLGLLGTMWMAAVARHRAADTQSALNVYCQELEMNALDALLAGKGNANQLIQDAETAGAASETLIWLRAMADANDGKGQQAMEALEQLRRSQGRLNVAAHATLASTYIEGGRQNDYLNEMVQLHNRIPATDSDRLMLGNSFVWLDEMRSEKMLRELVHRRDTPITRTMCARAMAVKAMLTGDKDLVSEAVRVITVAEIMSPELQLVNDTSVFVHHVAMLHSDGWEQGTHRRRGWKAAEWHDRGSYGELIRGNFYFALGEQELAKTAFFAAAQKGDWPAYYLAPFLFYTSPATALRDFCDAEFNNPDGAGALGAKAFLLALSPGQQDRAIEVADHVMAKYRDFDTRVDALCVCLLAGDTNVTTKARELKATCLGEFADLHESFSFLAGEHSLSGFERMAEAMPRSSHAFYAIGTKLLAEGRREDAITYLRRSASSPNFMSSYPFYARAILRQMETEPGWPHWLPSSSHGDADATDSVGRASRR